MKYLNKCFPILEKHTNKIISNSDICDGPWALRRSDEAVLHPALASWLSHS